MGGGACSTRGEHKYVQIPEEKRPVGERGANGRNNIKMDFKEKHVRVLTGINWLRTRSSGGFFERLI
jgi:hypothetical protein